jgi:hypothetical protein
LCIKEISPYKKRAEDDKQISQTAKRNIVIVAVVFGVFVTALVLIQLV